MFSEHRENVETKVAVAHRSADKRHRRRTQSVLTRRPPHPARPTGAIKQKSLSSGLFERIWLCQCPRKTTNSTLDAKTGLLTGLLAGEQGWKCPVALLATCCGSKSLKVILIDSDFRAYRAPKVWDGGVFHTTCTDFSRPVERLEYTCLVKSTFTEA